MPDKFLIFFPSLFQQAADFSSIIISRGSLSIQNSHSLSLFKYALYSFSQLDDARKKKKNITGSICFAKMKKESCIACYSRVSGSKLVCNLETFIRVPGSGEKRKLGWRSVNEKERPRWKGRGSRSKGPPSRQFTNTSKSP